MQKDSTRLLSQFSSNYNSNYRRIPFFRITKENRKPSTHWMGWFSSPPSSCSYAGTLLFARTERRVITRVFTCSHVHTQAHIRANVWNARLRAASSAVILTTLQPLCRPHACKPRMKSVRRSEREKRAGFTPRRPWRRLPPTTFLYFSPYTSASCFIPKNSIVLRFPPSSPRPSRGRAEPVPPPRRDVSSVEARPSRRRSHPRFVPRCASRYAAIRYTGLSVDLVSPCRSRLREESNHPRGDQRELSCRWELGYEFRPDERYRLEFASSIVSTHRVHLRVQLETPSWLGLLQGKLSLVEDLFAPCFSGKEVLFRNGTVWILNSSRRRNILFAEYRKSQ